MEMPARYNLHYLWTACPNLDMAIASLLRLLLNNTEQNCGYLMPGPSSLRRRTFQIFLLTFILSADYTFHLLFSIFQTTAKRNERRKRLHRRSAIRLREAGIRLKGILIKLAQFMSARVDILPDEYTEELALLQDQVPAAPFSDIRLRIQKDLGKDPFDIFEQFEEIPIASASLGQVHVAYLNGRKVAVKVQYPGIQHVVETDLRAVRIITRFLQHYFKTIRFDVLYDEFSKILHEELDYVKEGKNAERFRGQFSKDPRVVIPEVLWSHSTSHVLTLEYVEGIKINQYESLQDEGVSLTETATLLVESYIQQILQYRFFHGDPHPGNLFVQPSSGPGQPLRLVYVDFGLMQEITPGIYKGIQRMMLSIIKRENRGIALALVDLGFISRKESFRDIEQVVAFFMERYRDLSPKEFRNITLTQIREDISALFHVFPALQVPNHFILFARTAGMLNGVCSRLDPELNIIELARPHAERLAGRETLMERFMSKGRDIAQSLIDLPEALHSFLSLVNTDQFRTEMHSKDLSGILTRIYRLAYRGLLTVMALALLFYYGYLSPFLPHPERILVGVLMTFLICVLAWAYLREGKIP